MVVICDVAFVLEMLLSHFCDVCLIEDTTLIRLFGVVPFPAYCALLFVISSKMWSFICDF